MGPSGGSTSPTRVQQDDDLVCKHKARRLLPQKMRSSMRIYLILSHYLGKTHKTIGLASQFCVQAVASRSLMLFFGVTVKLKSELCRQRLKQRRIGANLFKASNFFLHDWHPRMTKSLQ